MPVPQKMNFIVEQASCLFLTMVRFNRDIAPISITCLGTGILPVPQKMNFIVEQASCLFLTMMQDLFLTRVQNVS
ncbi:hypothetical protein [Microcoleus sp. OTE_8_concoct_300]|uniref:hypothetical protein n=1 Tax=Microcoleus sp. OTE_8_concoct_300 TaxID=2964710 RepID=UPI00403F6DAB